MDTPVDLMYGMALRARELADEKMRSLRWLAHESEGYCSQHEADVAMKGKSRGELIEIILTDEFDLDAEELNRAQA